MAVKLLKPQRAERLFDGWQETMIWSCLQNVMGEIYVSDVEHVSSAAALLGDFCFLAGKPDADLLLFVCRRDFLILTPQNQAWEALIEEVLKDAVKKVTRYSFKKNTVFDPEKLSRAVDSLSPEYTLRMMDKECFGLCRENDWSRDLVSNFADYALYKKSGLGAVILKDGQLVSGASSYTAYREGIEIEIDTRKEYRRNGLAYICGAKLILECQNRGLYPSWDAQNQASASLAEKLGYVCDRAYPAYEVYGLKQGGTE